MPNSESHKEKHKDARANRSRHALINAGIQLLIRNPKASLKEVAEFAGVGRATLYRHFETREQLIQEIAHESLAVTDAIMEPLKAKGLSGKESLKEMFHALMPMADRYHFLLSLWSIAEQDDEVQAIYNRQLEELYALIEQARSEGDINHSLSTDWIIVTIDSLIYAGWWLVGEGKCSAEQAANNAVITLFQGIVNDS